MKVGGTFTLLTDSDNRVYTSINTETPTLVQGLEEYQAKPKHGLNAGGNFAFVIGD